ncbi:MAG TPA: cytochrome c [Candidatus Tectomicrobia bacterium]
MIRGHQRIARVLVVTCFGGALLGSAVVASAADPAGKKVYQKACQSCHGANGTPPPALAKSMNVPQATAAVLSQKADAELLRIIAEGAGKMPGYSNKMSPAEQKQVLEYMKTLGK